MRQSAQYCRTYALLVLTAVWLGAGILAPAAPSGMQGSSHHVFDLRTEQIPYISTDRPSKFSEPQLSVLWFLLEHVSVATTAHGRSAGDRVVLHDSHPLSRHLLYTQTTTSDM